MRESMHIISCIPLRRVESLEINNVQEEAMHCKKFMPSSAYIYIYIYTYAHTHTQTLTLQRKGMWNN